MRTCGVEIPRVCLIPLLCQGGEKRVAGREIPILDHFDFSHSFASGLYLARYTWKAPSTRRRGLLSGSLGNGGNLNATATTA